MAHSLTRAALSRHTEEIGQAFLPCPIRGHEGLNASPQARPLGRSMLNLVGQTLADDARKRCGIQGLFREFRKRRENRENRVC